MKRLVLFVIFSFFALQAQVTSYGTLITDPEDYFITKEPHKLQVNLFFIENLAPELMFFEIGDYTWRLPSGERRYFVRMRIPVYTTKDPQHKPIKFLSKDKGIIGTLDIKYETNPGRYFVTATLYDSQGNRIVRRHEYSPQIFNEINIAIIISNLDLDFTILKLTRARLKR